MANVGSEYTNTFSESIAKLLEVIPRWDEGPASIQFLCNKIGYSQNGEDLLEFSLLIIALLKTFDAIFVEEIDNELKIKARSVTSSLFILSLAACQSSFFNPAYRWG